MSITSARIALADNPKVFEAAFYYFLEYGTSDPESQDRVRRAMANVLNVHWSELLAGIVYNQMEED